MHQGPLSDGSSSVCSTSGSLSVSLNPLAKSGPKIVDGLQVEGTFRAHQVPLSDPATHPEHLKLLENWLRSCRPEELFDEQGRLKPELAELALTGERRMGANPHANGGILLRDLRMPDFRDYGSRCPRRGRPASATHMCSDISCAMWRS
jgi:xylulose-5-phosphate/fructose-6-phosphate phosphoketolase